MGLGIVLQPLPNFHSGTIAAKSHFDRLISISAVHPIEALGDRRPSFLKSSLELEVCHEAKQRTYAGEVPAALRDSLTLARVPSAGMET